MKFKDQLLIAAAKKYGRNKIYKISSLMGESIPWVKQRLTFLEEYLRIDPLKENNRDNMAIFWTKEKDLQLIRALKDFPSQFNTVGDMFGVSGETIEKRLNILQGIEKEDENAKMNIPIELAQARLDNQKTRKELRQEFLTGKKKQKGKKLRVQKFEFKNIFEFFDAMPPSKNKETL
ncbi:mRNA splicing protein CDC5 (Myb superfamily) [Pseudoloma neurophilia]|uniref:mRNA splicing protein CDC5 (Myb superfamily) n=1 Tax=Pseudoloma neurophilia TaxID=146866 RepID=A0A0R0M6B4_9MICR|nr:mRNA splicing protein CDC5 (Myb superfamily) [Pseudoloma neurophilia]